MEVKRLFVLIYQNHNDNAKRYKTRRYHLPKGIIENYSVNINGKNFYDQPIDSNIKRSAEITTGHGEDYTTQCLLDYDIKNHYSWFEKTKELDAYPKPAQQIEFVERLKNDHG